MFEQPFYTDVGLLREISADLGPSRMKSRNGSYREPKDKKSKKRKAAKMEKASRRKNRR